MEPRNALIAVAVAAAMANVEVAAQGAGGGACADAGAAGTVLAALAGNVAGIDAPAVAAMCAQIAELEQRAETAATEAAALRTDLDRARAQLPPTGSILLVDDRRGCPAGWTDVALSEPGVFAGRVPVAAGFSEGLSFRNFRQVGGSETVALSEPELPAHAHVLPLGFNAPRTAAGGPSRPGGAVGGSFSVGGSDTEVAVRALTGRERTERSGAGAAHENMPPFVALYWCRKT